MREPRIEHSLDTRILVLMELAHVYEDGNRVTRPDFGLKSCLFECAHTALKKESAEATEDNLRTRINGIVDNLIGQAQEYAASHPGQRLIIKYNRDGKIDITLP